MTTTESLAILGAATGVVGSVTGGLSLAWQVAAHRRSGRLVSVRSAVSIPVYGPPGQPEFRDDDQVAIKVAHRGEAPVTVTNYGGSLRRHFQNRRGKTNLFVMEPPVWGARSGTTLEPGGKPLEFLVPVADLRRLQREQRVPFRRMRGWVDLGDERRVFSKNRVPLK